MYKILVISVFILSIFNCPKNATEPNNVPYADNLKIVPEAPIEGQNLNLSYNFHDADGDSDKSTKKWYRNGMLIGVTGNTFPSDSANTNDKVKAKVTPYDGEDFGTEEFSNEVQYDRFNSAPSVSNVDIGPDDATFEDMIQLSYDYTDAESDPDHSIVEWYNNNTPIQTGGMTLDKSKTNIGDKIKATVKPYDGELEGTTKTSDQIIIQGSPYRVISGQILEHWSQTPDEGVRIITSVGETLTDANGNYTVQASTDREDVLVLKEGRLESGMIIPAGTNDETYNHTISNDTKEEGIDRWLFKNYVLKQKDENGYGRGDGPEDGQYVALTEESVPDTAWILGHIVDNNNFTWSVGFQNLEQINLLGKLINETANTATNGLYNQNRTAILIADNNYANANFDYPNMKAVPNETFKTDNPEQSKKYFVIRASETDTGLNATFYENDNTTIKGHGIVLANRLTGDTLEGVFNTEFYASIMGRLETPDGYGSLFDDNGREVVPHDTRITNWTTMRGPGQWYPDFPKDFNPELIDQHNNN